MYTKKLGKELEKLANIRKIKSEIKSLQKRNRDFEDEIEQMESAIQYNTLTIKELKEKLKNEKG